MVICGPRTRFICGQGTVLRLCRVTFGTDIIHASKEVSLTDRPQIRLDPSAYHVAGGASKAP